MPQFSLTQLLMAVTLTAILLSIIISEGCGRRICMVASLDFSPDGRQLVVAKYDAREINVDYHNCKTDVSRTISIVDVASASVADTVERVVLPGNRGAAFHLFRRGRRSVVFGVESGTLFVQNFDGANVKSYDLNSRQWRDPLASSTQNFRHLAISCDRKLLAAGSLDGVTLWDTPSGAELLRIVTDDSPLLQSSLIAFSADGELIATAGSGINLWNARDGTPRKVFGQPGSPDIINAIAFSPIDHTMVVASDDCLCVYDIDRNQQRVLRREGVHAIAFSPDGRKLAAGLDNEVAVVDLGTGQTISRMQGVNYAASLAFSPKGDLVAMEYGGDVLLWNPSNSDSQRITVPNGKRFSWPLPVVVLGFWVFTAWFVWSRRKTAKQNHATTLAGVRGTPCDE